MERKVKWNKSEKYKYDHIIYKSKCGRYIITKKRYASSRSGCWNNVGYSFLNVRSAEHEILDTLRDAKDVAEMHNDCNWEP